MKPGLKLAQSKQINKKNNKTALDIAKRYWRKTSNWQKVQRNEDILKQMKLMLRVYNLNNKIKPV